MLTPAMPVVPLISDLEMQRRIGARLRAQRERAGLSRAQLAAALAVSPRSIAGWETGRALPYLATIPRVCWALGCGATAILDDAAGSPNP